VYYNNKKSYSYAWIDTCWADCWAWVGLTAARHSRADSAKADRKTDRVTVPTSMLS